MIDIPQRAFAEADRLIDAEDLLRPSESYAVRSVRALARLIARHEGKADELTAFKREVSEAVKAFNKRIGGHGMSGLRARDWESLNSFIIPEPEPVDPLVEAVNEAWGWRNPHSDVTRNLREALTKRGGKIVFDEVAPVREAGHDV